MFKYNDDDVDDDDDDDDDCSELVVSMDEFELDKRKLLVSQWRSHKKV